MRGKQEAGIGVDRGEGGGLTACSSPVLVLPEDCFVGIGLALVPEDGPDRHVLEPARARDGSCMALASKQPVHVHSR